MRRSNSLSQLRGWKAAHQIRSGNDLETRAGHSQQPEQPQRHKGRFVMVINSFIGPRERERESFRRGRSSYGYARQGMKY